MALELATAFVRVKIDREQLKSEARTARQLILRELRDIRLNVGIDVKSAAASGKKAGEAASKAAQDAVSKNQLKLQNYAKSFQQNASAQMPGLQPIKHGFNGVPIQPNMFGGFKKGAKNFGAGALFGISPGASVATAFGGPAGAAGYGMAKASSSAVREFASYEHAFKRVEIIQKEAGATAQQIEKLEQQARDLGRSTVFSALEAAQAMVVLTQKGFAANEVYDQMPNVLNLAAAGQMEIAAAAGVVASAQKQFGKSAKETKEIVDVLAKASLNSSTDVHELGLSLSYVGNIADLSGKKLQSTVAALMLLRDAGMESSRSGTGLTRVYTKMSEDKVVEKFKAIRVSILDTNGSLRDLAGIIDDTNKAMASMSDSEKVAFSISAFGQRGGPAFASLLKQGGDALRENTELLEGFGGTAERVAKDSMDTLTGSSIRLKDAWKELGITFGETFGGGLRTTVDALQRTLVDIDKAAESVENFVDEASGRKTARLQYEGAKLENKSRKQLFKALINDAVPIEQKIENITGLQRDLKQKAESLPYGPDRRQLDREHRDLSVRKYELERRLKAQQARDIEEKKLNQFFNPDKLREAEIRQNMGVGVGGVGSQMLLNKATVNASKVADSLRVLAGDDPKKTLAGLAIAAPQAIAGIISGNPALGSAGAIRAAGSFQSQTFGIEQMASGIQASLSSKDSTQEDIKKKTADIAKSNQGILSTLQKADSRARYS